MPKPQPPRLGRGLSSLITVDALSVARDVPRGTLEPAGAASEPHGNAPPGAHVIEVPLDQIAPNPHQPRRSMDDRALAELSASIKSSGIIQPILVRRSAEGGFQLIAGERRWRAARLAGLATVPVIVKEVDGFTQAQMALIENIQREDLNPIDRAQAYRTLMGQLGLTQNELAGRLGEDRATVANFLRLLELPESVQRLVRDGKLPIGHAKLLGGVQDAKEQERLARLCLEQGLAVRNLERLVAGDPPKVNRKKIEAGNSMHLLDLERNISRQLGMRVQVRAGKAKGKGRLVIHYANLDQFDELMSRMGVKLDE